MKTKTKRWSIAGVCVLLLAGIGGYFYMSNSTSNSDNDTTKTETAEFTLPVAESDDVQEVDYSDLSIDSYTDVFNESNQQAIEDKVDELKESTSATFPDVLAISNPYLTNTTGLYVYFTTEEATKVSYTITAKGYEDYEGTLYNKNGTYSKEHEYQVIGFVGGVENTLTLTATQEDGTKQTTKVTYTPPTLQTTDSKSYKTTDGSSSDELSNGLYAVIGDQGTDRRGTYLVDNDGVIRAEYPVISYNANRLNFDDDNNMYYAVSKSKIVQENSLGEVTKVYNIGDSGYGLHHDMVLDDDGNLLVLATNKQDEEDENLIEDKIIRVNTDSGKVTSIADFRDLLPDLYSEATGIESITSYHGKWDPMHLNTIQYLGDDSIIVSSRETSTVIKLDNISSEADIDYFISDDSVWDGIGDYSDYVLDKDGDFTSQSGQHSVTYEEDDSLPDGEYYLYMFDNNSAIMDSRKDFDWSAYPDAGSEDPDDDATSHYYKYLVNENTGSYSLVDEFDVPYSPLISSVQNLENGNILVDSGQQGVFSEYDSDQNIIRTFTARSDSKFIYRVYKYDFTDFYFSE
ncbi:MAG: aryl-sulfate sulfotransferase [Enterococcus sp.]